MYGIYQEKCLVIQGLGTRPTGSFVKRCVRRTLPNDRRPQCRQQQEELRPGSNVEQNQFPDVSTISAKFGH